MVEERKPNLNTKKKNLAKSYTWHDATPQLPDMEKFRTWLPTQRIVFYFPRWKIEELAKF